MKFVFKRVDMVRELIQTWLGAVLQRDCALAEKDVRLSDSCDLKVRADVFRGNTGSLYIGRGVIAP